MVEERVVFDFTDEEVRKEVKRWYSRINRLYLALTGEGRKSYSVEDKGDKVIVSFVIKQNNEYDVIYYKKTTQNIEKLIKNKEPVDLAGCYIKDFDIRKIENYKDSELLNFDASHSFWDGNVSFWGAQFGGGDVSFMGAQFGEGDVYFNNAKFGEGNVSFKWAQFGKGEVIFDKSQFGEGDVSFLGAKFGKGNVSFALAEFDEGDVYFNNAEFGKGNVYFNNAEFGKGDVIFEKAEFGVGDVNFEWAQFGEGNVSFDWAQFGKGYVNFWKAQFGEGDVSFECAQFGEGYVMFWLTQFGEGDIIFRDAEADRVYFEGQNFLSYEDLRFESVNRLEIKDCILEKTLKVSGIHKKSSLSLKDTVNIGQICFEDNSKHVVKALGRNIKQAFKDVVNELFIRDKKDKNKEENEKEENKEENEKDKKMVIKRRINLVKEWLTDKEKYKKSITMVKENYHNLGDYEGEDRAYRLYMKYKTNTWYGWPLKFFSLVGGFGTQPITILLTMFSVWLGYAGYYFLELKDQLLPEATRFADTLYYSGITFLTIGYGDIQPVCDYARFASVSEGFLGLFLMSYLTVAVVRKLLR